MKEGFNLMFVFMAMLISVSCSNTLDITLPNYESKIVIDGSIENGKYPIVYLTLSSGYYDPVDSIELLNLVLTTAKVTVSDGETSEVLTLFRNTKVFPPFYYAGTDLRGVFGKSYTLEVISKGETYTATTTIPPLSSIDSLWVLPIENVDTVFNLRMSLVDDGLSDNYYRVFTKVLGRNESYVPSYQSIFSDRLFNGDSYTLTVFKGSESFTDVEDDLYFYKGDTISVKLCTVDESHFEFWRTLEKELYLTGNPFGSSGNQIISNIEGTKPALGVWGGYGATYKTLIIK